MTFEITLAKKLEAEIEYHNASYERFQADVKAYEEIISRFGSLIEESFGFDWIHYSFGGFVRLLQINFNPRANSPSELIETVTDFCAKLQDLLTEEELKQGCGKITELTKPSVENQEVVFDFRIALPCKVELSLFCFATRVCKVKYKTIQTEKRVIEEIVCGDQL